MIVGRVNETERELAAQDSYELWVAQSQKEGSVCSVGGCQEQSATAIQIRMYGLDENLVVPTCCGCAESRSILTDIKEETYIARISSSAYLVS